MPAVPLFFFSFLETVDCIRSFASKSSLGDRRELGMET